MYQEIKSGFIVVAPFGYGRREGKHQISEKWFNYCGFDGEAWPHIQSMPGENMLSYGIDLLDFLADLNSYQKVFSYFSELRVKCEMCKLLWVHKGEIPAYDQTLPPHFVYCGMDYGCVGEDGFYSFLFQEILTLKRFESLTDMDRKLNKYMLIPSMDVLNEIANARETLRTEGCDIEYSDLQFPYEPIHMYRYFD